MIIDTHAHLSTAAADKVLAEAGAPRRPAGYQAYPLKHGRPVPPLSDSADDIAGRLKIMDEADVGMQILSQPGGGHADLNVAIAAAKAHNDRYREIVSQNPTRFAAYGQLPWPHVDACVEEIRRAVSELGLVGVAIPASIQRERSPIDPEFEPVFAEANRLGCAIYLHPSGNGICSPFITKYNMNYAFGAPMEDTVMVEHLIVRKYPQKFPSIRFQVAHCGGAAPMILHRIDHEAPTRMPEAPDEPPSVTAKRLFFDSVTHGSKAGLRAAVEEFGADHIMAGSDFGIQLLFGDYGEAFHFIEDMGLSKDDVEMIFNGTAKRFFKLEI